MRRGQGRIQQTGWKKNREERRERGEEKGERTEKESEGR